LLLTLVIALLIYGVVSAIGWLKRPLAHGQRATPSCKPVDASDWLPAMPCHKRPFFPLGIGSKPVPIALPQCLRVGFYALEEADSKTEYLPAGLKSAG